MSFGDTIDAIREQGGLVYLADPFDRMTPSPIPQPCTVISPRSTFSKSSTRGSSAISFNDEALRFARKYRSSTTRTEPGAARPPPYCGSVSAMNSAGRPAAETRRRCTACCSPCRSSARRSCWPAAASPTRSSPVALSYERNHDPCWPLTVTSGPRSPAHSSVFVTMMPRRPPRPVLRNRHALQPSVILDVVRRVADRLHPHVIARVHVDRRDAAVRRLDQRQAEDGRGGRLGVAAGAAGAGAAARRRARAAAAAARRLRLGAAAAPAAALAAATATLDVVHVRARRIVDEASRVGLVVEKM